MSLLKTDAPHMLSFRLSDRCWSSPCCYERAAKNMFYLFVHSGKNEKNHILWSHERWGPTHWLHAFSLHCAVGKLVIHFNKNAFSSERWSSNPFFHEIRRSEHKIFLENNHLPPLNFMTGWIQTIRDVVGEKRSQLWKTILCKSDEGKRMSTHH